MPLLQLRADAMARTGDEMVVHHPGRLHESVANGRADELEPALEQVATHGIALRGVRGNVLHRTTPIYDRPSSNEGPEVAIEAAEFMLHREYRTGVGDRCRDLQSVPHDPRIGEQLGD